MLNSLADTFCLLLVSLNVPYESVKKKVEHFQEWNKSKRQNKKTRKKNETGESENEQ